MSTSMDDDVPPGLTQEETIAYLLGKVARYRFELEHTRRQLRQQCLENQTSKEQSEMNVANLRELSAPPSIVTDGSSSHMSGNSFDPFTKMNKCDSNEKMQLTKKRKRQDYRQMGIRELLEPLRSELAAITDDTQAITSIYYEDLKELRYRLSTYLDQKFIFDHLVRNSAKSSGYILIREQDLIDLLRVVTDNVAGIASNLAEVALFTSDLPQQNEK